MQIRCIVAKISRTFLQYNTYHYNGSACNRVRHNFLSGFGTNAVQKQPTHCQCLRMFFLVSVLPLYFKYHLSEIIQGQSTKHFLYFSTTLLLYQKQLSSIQGHTLFSRGKLCVLHIVFLFLKTRWHCKQTSQNNLLFS